MFASLKETLQALIAIAVLGAVFWGVRSHSRAELRAENEDHPLASQSDHFSAPREALSQGAKRHSGPRRPGIPSHSLDLPICADLSEALQQMQAAASRLRDGSALNVSQPGAIAQNEYQVAVSHVRAELQILHTLVPPEQYDELCCHVIERTLPDDLSRLAAQQLVNPSEGVSL